jgi:phenylpyruvate tautomerase PptA (4-oxalocrotonate tautomerase family)
MDAATKSSISHALTCCADREMDISRLEETAMPLYTAITEDGFVSKETKAKIAREITRIHTTIMKVPENFVRVVFLSYPKGSGFTAGKAASTAALSCVLRGGHSSEDKTEMLEQLWSMFQDLTGIPTDQLAMSLQELPASNAMEMGQIMKAVGHE